MNIPRKKPLGTNIIIHEDVLLSNIFIRLAAKQVAQMRSLSKTWNSLLSHPSFIKSHLDHSKDTNDEILLVFKDMFFSKDEPFTAHTTPDLQLTNSVKANMDSLEGYVVGAVNGLICLSTDERCTIWNPSLSASIDLPLGTIGLDHDIRPYKCFRFGFDHKTNDYKVVKLTFNYRKEWFPVEVFRVSKGSWETITTRFPSHVEMVLNLNDFDVDGYAGRLHYLCRVNSAQRTIVSFDLGDETFREIALPDSLPVGVKELGVLSQKLCLLSADHDVGCCEVWVMENYGVATSWVKRHVISRYKGDGVFPVVFTSKNHQFALGNIEHLTMYDPEASTFTEFKGGAPVSLTAFVVQYVNSLVWVTPTKWACNDVFKSSSQSENKPHLDYEEQGVTRPKSARERRKMPKKRHEHRSKRRSSKK